MNLSKLSNVGQPQTVAIPGTIAVNQLFPDGTDNLAPELLHAKEFLVLDALTQPLDHCAPFLGFVGACHSLDEGQDWLLKPICLLKLILYRARVSISNDHEENVAPGHLLESSDARWNRLCWLVSKVPRHSQP